MEAETKQLTEKELKTLHEGKTGALFIAAIRGRRPLAGATEKQLLALTQFAQAFWAWPSRSRTISWT
jgi:geranylgeranyl diphosphate synthase type II